MLSLADEAPPIGIEALKTNVSTTVKAAIHMGQNDHENLENFRYTNFKELQILFHVTQKLLLHHKVEILSVTTIEWTSPSRTRFTHFLMIKCSSGRKRESTRMLRFRLMLGANFRSVRSKSKMGGSSKRISTVRFLQRINNLELMENRLSSSGIFPSTYVIGNPPENPERSARSKN